MSKKGKKGKDCKCSSACTPDSEKLAAMLTERLEQVTIDFFEHYPKIELAEGLSILSSAHMTIMYDTVKKVVPEKFVGDALHELVDIIVDTEEEEENKEEGIDIANLLNMILGGSLGNFNH